jgi:indole-3-glycerol phosphate synthase
MTILDEIFSHKQQEVLRQRSLIPLAQIQERLPDAPPARNFPAALLRASRLNGRPALIAEIKRASPSRGVLALHVAPTELASLYAVNGAAAISILTDQKYFNGSLEYLEQVRSLDLEVPFLRKDFICDPYQVYQSRLAGADAVLLIVTWLSDGLLSELHALVLSLGMTPLVEVHSAEEVKRALSVQPVMIGINNRDLKTFTVDLGTSLRLRELIPSNVLCVAESGIHSPEQAQQLYASGIHAILVGEALVTAGNIAEKVRSLACST